MPTPRLTIAQIGPWPPPYGGVAIYLQRLARAAARAGHRVVVLDLSDGPGGERRDDGAADGAELTIVPIAAGKASFARVGAELAARGVDVAHMHLIGLPPRTLAPITAVARAAGVAVVASVHSLRPATYARGDELALRAALPGVAAVLASGADVAAALPARGVDPARITAVPPFLPPTLTGPPIALLTPPIAAMRARWPRLVVGGGTALVPYGDGPLGGRGEMYGADVFVDLAAALAARHPDVGFVYQLPRAGDAALRAALLDRIDAATLGERLLLHEAPLAEAAALWAVADLFVRSSRTDGDSVALREALAFGVPALASDAVARPAAACTFRDGDGNQAAVVAAAMLADLDAARARVAACAEPDGGALALATLERAGGGADRHLRRMLRPATRPLGRVMRRWIA